MKAHRIPFLFVLSIIGASNVTALGQAKDEKKPMGKPVDKAPTDQPPGGDDMAKMMEMGKPGEFHAKLKPFTGKWATVTKWRMAPDQPWDESKGTAEYKWILGDRVQVQDVKGTMMGGPFEGHGMTGYDAFTKKYWNVWTDSMGGGAMTSTGTVDGSGKTFTYSGDYDDPMTGQKKTAKSTVKILGDDKFVFEMYDKGPDGKEFVMLEVTYTRQK